MLIVYNGEQSALFPPSSVIDRVQVDIISAEEFDIGIVAVRAISRVYRKRRNFIQVLHHVI